jgi:hypothetical protein
MGQSGQLQRGVEGPPHAELGQRLPSASVKTRSPPLLAFPGGADAQPLLELSEVVFAECSVTLP